MRSKNKREREEMKRGTKGRDEEGRKGDRGGGE